MFLGLFGCLFRHGGVERAARLTGAVLTRMADDLGQPCRLLGLNDDLGTHSFVVDGLKCSSIGFGRNKVRFLAHALRSARLSRVVFLGHPNLAPIGRALQLINPELRYWVAAHGVEVWHPLGAFRRAALRKAEGVTAPSRDTVEHLIINQGVIPKKVALLPYCLDPGFNDRVCSNHLSPSSQSASVLTVGRLLRSEPGKGVDTVIRAFPKVLQAVPSAEYIIIGDGNHRSYLEQLAKETGVRERVSFLGPQNDDELREHYRKAAVFAMPSRQEGFGIVYLEAMSFAKPVVAAGFGGAPDIVIDGLTGFLIPYGDVDALADRLICLLRNADLRCKLGISGRARVEAHYSFGGFRQQLADLLTPSLPV